MTEHEGLGGEGALLDELDAAGDDLEGDVGLLERGGVVGATAPTRLQASAKLPYSRQGVDEQRGCRLGVRRVTGGEGAGSTTMVEGALLRACWSALAARA